MTPEEWHTLHLCEGGRVIRSNYTADHPELRGWRVHWKSLDVVIRYGFVHRLGKYYCLTEAGRERLHPSRGVTSPGVHSPETGGPTRHPNKGSLEKDES